MKKRETMKAYYETVGPNPDTKALRKVIMVLLEGEWDGEKFTHYDENGLETVVKRKEWVLFEKPEKYQ